MSTVMHRDPKVEITSLKSLKPTVDYGSSDTLETTLTENGVPRSNHVIEHIDDLPPKCCFLLQTVLVSSVSAILLWTICYVILGSTALPDGALFSLLVAFVAAVICGKLVGLFHCPPLLGMLVAGIVLNNLPYADIVGEGLDRNTSSVLRSAALAILLMRAGLGLDINALIRLKFTVFGLAFLPCTMEAVTIAFSAHFLLQLPLMWAFMLGFLLAGVSLAVVVPCLLTINEKGLGTESGVPTLLIASAAMDNVVVISSFSVLLGIHFSQGSLLQSIIQGPLEVVIGLSFALVYGSFVGWLPRPGNVHVEEFRKFLFLCGGLLAIFGSQKIGYSGAGALGCLTMAFVSGYWWRKHQWTNGQAAVSSLLVQLWLLFEPLLFVLIGAEVSFKKIDMYTLAVGSIILVIGLTIRLIVSFLVIFGSGLNIKEKLFVAISWSPKATVQAALGSIALSTAIKLKAGEQEIAYGYQLLTLAVLAIIVTSPIGAAGIVISAPKLLKRSEKEKTPM